jgi:hypothetical protein
MIKKVNIDITNTPLVIEVDEKRTDAQYALEFLWKEGNKINGRSMLNFKLD